MCRRSPPLSHRLDRPVPLAQDREHRFPGQHFLLRPFVRATDVHIFDKPDFRLHLLAELDQRTQLIVIEPPDRHRIELQAGEARARHRRNPFHHPRIFVAAGQLTKPLRPQRIEADGHAVQPCIKQRLSLVRQENPVRREGDIRDLPVLDQQADQPGQVAP